MPESVPRVNQAFTYSVVLRDAAGAIILDPLSVYETDDVELFFGTSAIAVKPVPTRRGGVGPPTTPILDIPITGAQHNATPVIICLFDRDGTAFIPIYRILYTIPETELNWDGSYIREKTTGGSVLRHVAAGIISGDLVIDAWVEGEVP